MQLTGAKSLRARLIRLFTELGDVNHLHACHTVHAQSEQDDEGAPGVRQIGDCHEGAGEEGR